MSTHPKKTAAQRRVNRYGTKRYAMHKMCELMREWAKAKRANTTGVWSQDYAEHLTYGCVLGARTALASTGAINSDQQQKISARIKRILGANTTRRPLQLVKVAV